MYTVNYSFTKRNTSRSEQRGKYLPRVTMLPKVNNFSLVEPPEVFLKLNLYQK